MRRPFVLAGFYTREITPKNPSSWLHEGCEYASGMRRICLQSHEGIYISIDSNDPLPKKGWLPKHLDCGQVYGATITSPALFLGRLWSHRGTSKTRSVEGFPCVSVVGSCSLQLLLALRRPHVQLLGARSL